MKICPQCSFSNTEEFPTCVWCNVSIAGVPSTACADPASREHERDLLRARRHTDLHRQLRSAALLYALVITGSAVVPGLVLSPVALAGYFASGLIVALAVQWRVAGQFTASLLQGALSLPLLIFLGPLQPLIFFMLVLHVILPAVLWHWMDMILNAHR